MPLRRAEAFRRPPFGETIRVAFVYGSMARSEELSESDVDLMVIGRAQLAALSPEFSKAAETLGREVNPTVISPANRTEPSPSKTLTPPGCRLRAARQPGLLCHTQSGCSALGRCQWLYSPLR